MNNGYRYSKSEEPYPTFRDNKDQYFYIRTGVIEGVDVKKYEMTVRWFW